MSGKQKLKINVMRRFGTRCFYCGCQLTPSSMTLDHFVPRSLRKGVPYNLRPACVKCNRAKGDLTAAEFKKHIYRLSIRFILDSLFGRRYAN